MYACTICKANCEIFFNYQTALKKKENGHSANSSYNQKT
jgi:hypothetical protein